MTIPQHSRLPLGSEVRLNATTRSYAGGTVLLGGSPTRLVRLRNAPPSLLQTGRLAVTSTATATLADRLLHIGIADIELDSVPPISLDQLTIVVPIHGAPEQLDRLLGALHGVRTIVVDDASPDAPGIAHVAARHSATLLRLPVNSGPATARNHGLQRVDTPFVAFCDADTAVTMQALQNLLRHFHDQRVAIAAPRIVALKDNTTPNWITRYEAVRSSLDLGATSGVVRPHSRVGWLPAACLVARVNSVGSGFEQSMRMGEDVDLVWRLAAQGWIIRYDADVTVAHEHRRIVRAWLGRKYKYGTSAAPLAARHGNAVAPAIMSPAFAVMNGSLLAQRRWSIPIALSALTMQTLCIRRQVGAVQGRRTLAFEIAGQAAAESLYQLSGLMIRSWWPATCLVALRSHRARRALAVAAIGTAITEWLHRRPNMDVARYMLARRLDDAAEGLGIWSGACRQRSIRCQLPVIRVSKRDVRQAFSSRRATAIPGGAMGSLPRATLASPGWVKPLFGSRPPRRSRQPRVLFLTPIGRPRTPIAAPPL